MQEAADLQRGSKGKDSSFVNLDNEVPLVAVRFTQGCAGAKLGDAHMEAGVSLGRFEIQDLLVGPRSRSLAFLARSFEAGGPGIRLC